MEHYDDTAIINNVAVKFLPFIFRWINWYCLLGAKTNKIITSSFMHAAKFCAVLSGLNLIPVTLVGSSSASGTITSINKLFTVNWFSCCRIICRSYREKKYINYYDRINAFRCEFNKTTIKVLKINSKKKTISSNLNYFKI